MCVFAGLFECVFSCIYICVQCPGIQTVNLDLAEWGNVKTVVGGLGYFDLLVNSAGVTRVGPFLDVSEDDID